MRTLIGFVPLLACVAMTWGCARMMSRRSSAAPTASVEEVSQLKDEVAALRAELATPTEPTPARGDRA